MNLKLASYSTEGKFEGFKELGREFGQFAFAGNCIMLMSDCNFCDTEFSIETIDRDEKDPLNRFNGLFNGRTFGNGRFVLEVNKQDTLNLSLEYKEADSCLPRYNGYEGGWHLLVWGENRNFIHFYENKFTTNHSIIKESDVIFDFTSELHERLKQVFPAKDKSRKQSAKISAHENPELFSKL